MACTAWACGRKRGRGPEFSLHSSLPLVLLLISCWALDRWFYFPCLSFFICQSRELKEIIAKSSPWKHSILLENNLDPSFFCPGGSWLLGLFSHFTIPLKGRCPLAMPALNISGVADGGVHAALCLPHAGHHPGLLRWPPEKDWLPSEAHLQHSPVWGSYAGVSAALSRVGCSAPPQPLSRDPCSGPHSSLPESGSLIRMRSKGDVATDEG